MWHGQDIGGAGVAILDKLKSVGGAIKHKVVETFGEGRDGALDDLGAEAGDPTPALDAAGARRVLDLGAGATLADVREAYRRLARSHFGRARREGPDSAAAHVLERALEGLELLEEELLPLGGPGPTTAGRAPTSQRKRATPRAR